MTIWGEPGGPITASPAVAAKNLAPAWKLSQITRAFGGEMAEWFNAHAWKA